MIGTFSRKLCPDGLMKLEYSHVIKQEITYMTSLIFQCCIALTGRNLIKLGVLLTILSTYYV